MVITCKSISTSHAANLLDYAAQKGELYEGHDPQELTEWLEWDAARYPKIKNTAFAIVVNPSEDEHAERWDRGKWGDVALDVLEKMGLDKQPYTIMWHPCTNSRQDAGKLPHLHIVVMRIDDKKEKAISDKFIGLKATRVANAITKEMGQKTAEEYRKEHIAELRKTINKALQEMKDEGRRNFDPLVLAEKLGNSCEVVRKNNGTLQGFNLIHPKGAKFKLSELGKAYTLPNLEKAYRAQFSRHYTIKR